MRVAFVGLKVDAEQAKTGLSEHYDKHVDAVELFDSVFTALAFLGEQDPDRILVLNREMDQQGDALNIADNMGITVQQVFPPVSEHYNYSAFKDWYLDELTKGSPVPVEQVQEAANPMASVLQNENWEEGLAQEEEVPEPTPEPVSEEPKASAAESKTDDAGYNMGVIPEPAPTGLNHKIEYTADMINPSFQKVASGYQPSDKGYLLLVTSGHGGAGKTTVSYYATQVTAMALNYSQNQQTKVLLIEGDYDNPKLQNRLRIEKGRDLATLANFLEDVSEGRERGTDAEIAAKAQDILQDIIYDDPASKAKVIACPYDSSRAKPAFIKEALKKAVLWAQRTMGYFVILDCDTIGLPTGIELDLVQMANRIVIVADTRELEVKKSRVPWGTAQREHGNPNDRSHIDDARVMIRKLTRPIDKNGFGIPGDTIRVFFNATSAKELKNKVLDKELFPKNMVIGTLEYLKEIDRAWAGDIGDNPNKSVRVAQAICEFLYLATHKVEFDRLSRAMGQ